MSGVIRGYKPARRMAHTRRKRHIVSNTLENLQQAGEKKIKQKIWEGEIYLEMMPRLRSGLMS